MSTDRLNPLPPILPAGTAVVALVEVRGPDGRPLHPRGSAGIITKSPADPEHSYRVRFPGGDEHTLRRRDLQALRHYQREGLSRADPLTEHDLHRHVIYRCVVGSRAYGLDHGESDTDRRGIYLPPAHLHWSIYGVPEQIESPETEECYWELEKFLRLALKANPNVLEALYTPLVEHATPLARELLAMRGAFLSRLVYQTFNGYAMSQFQKLEQDLRSRGQIKWKHAMHLIRLLLSGTTALRTGELPVRVQEHRDALIRVRDGLMPWEEVDRWRLALHGEFERAFQETRLPERPDYEAANGLLVRARRDAARAGVESPEDAARASQLEQWLREAAPVLTLVARPRDGATLRYDLMSDAVYWSDETPPGSAPVEATWALRPVLHHRARLMLGGTSDHAALWDLARSLFPQWVGFRPDRVHPSEAVLSEVRAKMAAGARETRKVIRWAGKMPTGSMNLALCERIAARHEYPLLFVTVSGAHLYGFPSPDSDYDLRGVHILPAREVLGLSPTRDTIEREGIEEGVEIDLVTHDAAKFFRLMLKKNGYVLEQLYSPLIIRTSPEHEELKRIGALCITRHHVHHYLGFLETQWKLFLKESPPRVKPLLYVYRVILTGIHLMRTGRVEANLVVLNEEFKLPYIGDLIARKLAGPELGTLEAADIEFHTREKERLEGLLKQAGEETTLREQSEGSRALSDLLVRLRGL